MEGSSTIHGCMSECIYACKNEWCVPKRHILRRTIVQHLYCVSLPNSVVNRVSRFVGREDERDAKVVTLPLTETKTTTTSLAEKKGKIQIQTILVCSLHCTTLRAEARYRRTTTQ